MNWLGASPLLVGSLWIAASALAVWLYLHTRRPQRRTVSTLRFWAAVQPGESRQRRRISEPWALLAQLFFLLLLFLALGNLQWGSAPEARRVVMILDTSVWSELRPAGEAPWIDQIKQKAQTVLNGLPLTDEVMLISAEPDALPIERFTTDRTALRKAIAQVQPAASIAEIPHALEIGKGALASSRRALLFYVGPGMVDEGQAGQLDEFRNKVEQITKAGTRLQFLVRLAGVAAPVHNQGITRFSLRRDPAKPDLWHTLTQLKNYSENKSTVSLKLSVAGQSIAEEKVSLAPGEVANAEDQFDWTQDGVVQADISPSDDLDADNHAAIRVHPFRPTRVALIGTDSPFSNDVFTAFVSNPYLQIEIVRPGATPQITPDVAIYESRSLPSHLAFNSIWFLKGKDTADSRRFRVAGWNSQHPVTRWVSTRDVSVRNPSLLKVLPGDTILATLERQPSVPLILAREMDGHRMVILGFDPDDSNFAQQQDFPLMLAGCLEWMAHPIEENADSYSVGEIDLPGPASRVVGPSGKNVAFQTNGPRIHFLATESGTYRMVAPSGDSSFTVNLPALPARRLDPTPLERSAIEPEPPLIASWEVWRWLVGLAMFALWAEWWLYYSSRRKTQTSEDLPSMETNKAIDSYLDLGESHGSSETHHPSLRI